jgi:hypothetical protein
MMLVVETMLTGLIDLQCPTCRYAIEEHDAKRLLEPKVYDRYTGQQLKRQFTENNIDFNECPSCGHINDAVESEARQIIQCAICHCQYKRAGRDRIGFAISARSS